MPEKNIQNVLGEIIDRNIDSIVENYKHFHANPELSLLEKKTSARVAEELRAIGIEVTEHVGKYRLPDRESYGVVGLLANGEGPTILIRTDLDALPVREKTGLPYASQVTAENADGEKVPVMHACAHDINISCFIGVARALVEMKEFWSGTLVFVAQPAEEIGLGAKAMLEDGLYSRFPRPDYALALHADPGLGAGKVSCCGGYALAGVDLVDIIIHGVGGHGAYPEKTIDPIVLAARTVLALQTIVSRELNPLDPAVVTIGSIEGGTKHNIIPDEVKLKLTLRFYKEEVRESIIAAIRRITKGIAISAGLPEDRAPEVIYGEEFLPPVFNSPVLVRTLFDSWRKALGEENVSSVDPRMVGEDFAYFAPEGSGIQACIFWVGCSDAEELERFRAQGIEPPSLHSPQVAPVPEPTIRTGIRAMVSGIIEVIDRFPAVRP